MAAIGNSPTQQAFTPAIDYFSGNGSTTAFTLSRPVASVAQVQVTIDNVAQNPSSAYTVSSNTITFTSAPLSGTNNIYVYYTSPITQVIAPGQGTVNTTALGNITNIASGNSSLTLQTGSGNTTAVTVDTSQNVGIGTASPAVKLDVNGITGWNGGTTGIVSSITGVNAAITDGGNLRVITSTTQAADVGGSIALGGYYTTTSQSVDYAVITGKKENGTGGNTAGYMSFGTRTNSSSTSERMRIDSSGNVGIGTTTPKVRLAGKVLSINGTDSGASYQASIELLVNGASAGEMWANSNDFVIGSFSTQPMIFRTQNIERMRILSSGTFLFSGASGGTSAEATGTITTYANGSAPYVVHNIDAQGSGFTFNIFKRLGTTVGSISYNGTGVQFNTTSDYRLKENIRPAINALDMVAKLKPRLFNWKETGEEELGFIAHEFQEEFPNAVTGKKDDVETYTDEDGNEQTKIKPQGIDTSFLVATLTAAIQELSAKNDALTARIEALENR